MMRFPRSPFCGCGAVTVERNAKMIDESLAVEFIGNQRVFECAKGPRILDTEIEYLANSLPNQYPKRESPLYGNAT